MSEFPPKKTEAELEADVDYMIDVIYEEITSGKLPMSVGEVNRRVREILTKRGMIKGGSRSSRKSSRKSRRNKRNKKSTRRRRR